MSLETKPRMLLGGKKGLTAGGRVSLSNFGHGGQLGAVDLWCSWVSSVMISISVSSFKQTHQARWGPRQGGPGQGKRVTGDACKL